MDGQLPEVREGGLLDSIANDDRIPGVRVFVARTDEDEDAVGGRAVLTLVAPITAERIEQLAVSIAGTGNRAAGDAA
jgi:hypothetical protein